MLDEDKEANLLERIRLFVQYTSDSIYCFSNTETVQSLVDTLCNDEIWKNEWIDNSSKDAPPPDFYNEKRGIMLEVMRIDDHAYVQNGKIINPTNQRARAVEKELKERGLLNSSPNARLFINSPTELPSLEDHNYRFYKENFKRIIEKHKKQIAQYKNNHPGYKLVFFIYDESSMYCQVDTPNRTIKEDERFEGKLHYWFFDKAFKVCFMDSGIDFFVWFTPYKWIKKSENPIELPLACVFDCNQTDEELIEYPDDYMMSTEE